MGSLPADATFSVDPVQPATDRLPECCAHDGFVRLSGRQLLACSDYSGMVVAEVAYNPLVYAVHRAYADHRPLVLSPDMVWLVIAQGIKHHILLHAEELRSDLVFPTGTSEVVVDLPKGFLLDSPYAEWGEVIERFGEKTLKQVRPDRRELMLERFSTTGPREHCAFVVTMMDAFQRYFDYMAMMICGIPRITLEGTPADWQRMGEKAGMLDEIGLGWWRERLDPVLAHFLRASKGDVDQSHWRSTYKIWKRYGDDKLTGWIVNLFPYLWDEHTGRIYKNEEMLRDLPEEPEGYEAPPQGDETPYDQIFPSDDESLSESERYRAKMARIDAGLRLDQFPLGLSTAPLAVAAANGRGTTELDLIAGFTGIRQLGEDGALRPAIGWAVSRPTGLRRLLDEVEANHRTTPRTRWHYVRYRRGRQRRLEVVATSAEELLRHLLASPRPVLPVQGCYEPVRDPDGWWRVAFRGTSDSGGAVGPPVPARADAVVAEDGSVLNPSD